MNAATARTTTPARVYDPTAKGSSIENLWVILVPEESNKTPMLARAGDGLYLLAFRTGFTARKFMTDSGLSNGEPRMVVGSILPQILASVADKEIKGVLVDYDFLTHQYREASLMY